MWWIDATGVASKHPRRVGFSSGPGPVVKRLKWKKWGYPKATARGVYVEPAMIPGAPDSVGKAKIVARKPMSCRARFGTRKGKRTIFYRRVALNFRTAAEVWMGDPGTTVDISGLAGRQVCMKPAAG